MPEQDEPKKTQSCPSCGHAMTVASVIPKLGGLPQLTTFQCPGCDEVITMAAETAKEFPPPG